MFRFNNYVECLFFRLHPKEKKFKQFSCIVIRSKCSEKESWFWQHVLKQEYRTTTPHRSPLKYSHPTLQISPVLLGIST